MAKKLGEMWNNLSDSEKQPYITKAAKLKEKYEKDVADYKSKGKFDGAKGPAKVPQKKVEEEEEEEDVRPRGSAYFQKVFDVGCFLKRLFVWSIMHTAYGFFLYENVC